MTDTNVIKLAQPGTFTDLLTEILRTGAHALLTQAVEVEVADFLSRYANLKTEVGRQRVVRHGHLPEREIMTGIGPVAVRQPRVRDREATEGERIRFRPSILPPYARRTKSLEVLIPILYLKGISTGDFEEALGALLGKDAGGLSASTIARLKEAWVSGTVREPTFFPVLEVKTSLTHDQIQESFATPETIAFWDLPQFIEQAEAAGFSATKHRLHYHALLAAPVLLCAMIFIAAAFSLRLARLGGAARLIVSSVLTGFVLYFFADVSRALGISGVVPVVLAAWAPATTALLLGMAYMFNQEDG